MFSTHPLDWAIIALYAGALIAVWATLRRRRGDVADYLVAGRRVTLPAFVLTLVSTWYGGILGVGEYGWRYGVSNWLVFGLPYYAGAVLFGLFFARRAREADIYTIPDLLHRTYGRGPALLGALGVFVNAAPAAYVLMLGTLGAAMTGLPLVACIVTGALLSLFYTWRGGLRGVIATDAFQFALMFGGFALLVGVLVARHGALPFEPGALPGTHFTWHGGNPPQAIFVWYVIALGTLVDPGFWQRAAAARDARTARRGVFLSVGFWMIFDLLTTTCGLYARALLPGLENPVFAFPELARVTLPPLALGLFYVGLLATVMSTIDSYGFVAATTVGRDVVWRLRGDADETRVATYTRAGLCVSGAFAVALALARPSVVQLWHDIGSIVTPMLLIPVAAALLGRGRLPARWTLAAMAAPVVVTLGWVLWKDLGPAGRYPLELEPIYAGLGTSLAVYVPGWLTGRASRPLEGASP
jgi:SSS family solute:Na+ symporter